VRGKQGQGTLLHAGVLHGVDAVIFMV
jgi:hypothetical protein